MREPPVMEKSRAITVSEITKKFGGITAVDHVTFEDLKAGDREKVVGAVMSLPDVSRLRGA